MANRIMLQSDLALRGRLTVQEWQVPLGGQFWLPSPGGGRLRDQLRAAGFVQTDEERTPNEVLNTGRNLLRDFLAGDSVTGIERYAVGTTATDPDKATQTKLLAEVWRGSIASFAKDVAKLTVEAFLPSSFANGSTLVEAGPFGNGATDSADSGTCYARATFSAKAKTDQKAYIFSHDLFLGT